MKTLNVSTGYYPHTHQLAIHNELKRFSVLVCHRRFGKTVLAINTLIDAALRFKGGDGRFGYVAPYLKQAKQIAWDYLLKFGQCVPGTKFNQSELFVEFPNGNRIRLYGADNADAMRGLYFDGVVPDEVADMKPEVWGEILRPALADRKGWCLFIGTPKGMNMFYDLYQEAVNNPDWYGAMFRADETKLPWLDDKELGEARKTMSDNQYRQEFLCDFGASCDNILITIDMASEAAARIIKHDAVEGLPKILGVDVARFGDDRSVLMKRQGIVAHEPIVYQGLDNMELVGRVATIIQQWKPDAVFIDGGRGEGVIDRLRQMNHDVIEVQFGSKASDGHYFNKRSEMWDLMAKWIQSGGGIPNHTALKTDLCTPTYGFKNASGKFALESKDEMKSRGAKSPDLGDALALTFAFPVARAMSHGNAGRAISNFDPNEFDARSDGGKAVSDFDPNN